MAKLVAIGDSITQGFQSGAISKTGMSYPAMIAKCLGAPFRRPDFNGAGGLPVNLEDLLRLLARRYGQTISWFEVPLAVGTLHTFMSNVEDYWERGDGLARAGTGPLHHNLAVWGFEVGEADTITYEICGQYMPQPSDNLLPWNEIPEFGMYRTARRVLNPSQGRQYAKMTQIDAATKIAQDEGIDNLLLWLGANNCLGTVTSLSIRWSEEDDLGRYPHVKMANLWTVDDFRAILKRVYTKAAAIGANKVFVATVPHVTIAPVCRGISPNEPPHTPQHKYYEYYTHFWIWDYDFRKASERYPCLTADQAMLIDETVDQYNEAIRDEAQERGWHVVDICKMLDRLAFRRSGGAQSYAFPQGLKDALLNNPNTRDRVLPDGRVLLDTRYLRLNLEELDPLRRYQGGIFSLDGIHPTTIGYGLIAHEFLEVMRATLTSAERHALKPLDWDEIVASDNLVNNPPENLADLQNIMGFLASKGPILNLIKTISGWFPTLGT